jgi:Concanavalin A-like lectin/glucanases superfamily
MSASVVVAIPFVLFAIVLLLCFVGCNFEVPPTATSFTNYTHSILNEPTLVAYWPLGEAAGETIALELKGGRSGAYLSRVFPDDPSIPSAAAPGTLILGQPGIVAGDTVPPHDASSARTTCIEVNGGYVSVPFDAALNPPKADGFTIEAWVRVGWSASDTAAHRVIMASLDTAGGVNKGYVLSASPDNIWQGSVLTGGGQTVASGPEVIFDATSHLVLTYDGALLRLFVNGTQSIAIATDYQASTQSSLFIGAGGTQLPEPRAPWVGKIQCVALYKGALSLDQVREHALHGNGVDVP